MTSHSNPLFATIADVSAQLRECAVSPVALTDACLARIEALNPKVNAFITVTAELARNEARSAEDELRAGKWRSPLHGLPVAIKDFYDTAGIRTTPAGDQAVGPENTFFANYFGLPAITVPGSTDTHGVPLGIQFVGPRASHRRVLALARAYQRARSWRFVPPQGFD
jgi:Asp-tRNA(Asn)/Glu-tRNA(Gln) amidotransferase A subunit family amidase